jgi:hypothetical protein
VESELKNLEANKITFKVEIYIRKVGWHWLKIVGISNVEPSGSATRE